MSLRNIPFSTSLLTDNQGDWAFFLKLQFGGTIGTKYFTDAPGGFTGNVDGSGSRVWIERFIAVPSIQQNSHGALKVSSFVVDNGDYTFGNWANSPGIQGVPATVYVGWWNKTHTTFQGAYILYDGACDDGVYKLYAQITLRPSSTMWAKRTGGSPISALCPFIYMDPDTCQKIAPRPGVAACLIVGTAQGQTSGVSIGTSVLVNRAGDFSVAAWVYTNMPTGGTDQMTVIGNYVNGTGANSTGWDLRIMGPNFSGRTGFNLVATFGDGAGNSSASPPNVATTKIPYGTWTHIAMVKTSLSVRFFINGAYVGTGTMTRNQVANVGNTLIGADPNAAVGVIPMVGALNHVRYYNSALTDDAVYNIYSGGSIGSPTGNWALTDNTGTTVADASGNALTGTFVGSPTPTWVAEPNGEKTCGHLRQNCIDRANQTHFGGEDLMLPAGTVLNVMGQMFYA